MVIDTQFFLSFYTPFFQSDFNQPTSSASTSGLSPFAISPGCEGGAVDSKPNPKQFTPFNV